MKMFLKLRKNDKAKNGKKIGKSKKNLNFLSKSKSFKNIFDNQN